MKLRGRAEAPAIGAEGAQFLSARGANQEAPHGPLQRLLDGPRRLVRAATIASPMASIVSPVLIGNPGTIHSRPAIVRTANLVASGMSFARKKPRQGHQDHQADRDESLC